MYIEFFPQYLQLLKAQLYNLKFLWKCSPGNWHCAAYEAIAAMGAIYIGMPIQVCLTSCLSPCSCSWESAIGWSKYVGSCYPCERPR